MFSLPPLKKQKPMVEFLAMPSLPNSRTTLEQLGEPNPSLRLQSPSMSPQLSRLHPPCLRSATVSRHTGLLLLLPWLPT